MLISKSKIISIIKEEIEKNKVMESNSISIKMPPKGFMGKSSSKMPPEEVLGAENNVDVDVPKLERPNPAELEAAIKNLYNVTRKKIGKIIIDWDKIDEIMGDPVGLGDIKGAGQRVPSRRLWFEDEMGSGMVGMDSDNERFIEFINGVRPVSNAKYLLEWMRDFHKKLEEENDVEVGELVKNIIKNIDEIRRAIVQNPVVTGMTPVFGNSQALRYFPVMESGDFEGGGKVPAYKKDLLSKGAVNPKVPTFKSYGGGADGKSPKLIMATRELDWWEDNYPSFNSADFKERNAVGDLK